MKILVVDFAGHSFQAELSRALCAKGHMVRHAFAARFTGPKGALSKMADDPSDLSFVALGSASTWRTSLVGRLLAGLSFGRALAGEIKNYGPDVVIASNVPPEALLLAQIGQARITWIWWVQDLLGQGSKRVLARKTRALAWLVGNVFDGLEAWLASKADAIVVVSERFKDYIPTSQHDKVTVLHNWAPIAELPTVEKRNGWASSHGLADSFNFLYAGTLGWKHNPDLLVELARAFASNPSVRVVVVSEGPSADYLRRRARELDLKHLIALPFQPHSRLPEVMGTADVLITLLEEEAGVFSVPSKILSYLCAGRPILGAMPVDNLASTILREAGAGIVLPSVDTAGFIQKARDLAEEDPSVLQAMGASGRRFAERNFQIDEVVTEFIKLAMQGRAQGAVS